MHPKELQSEQNSGCSWVHHLEHQSVRWKDLSWVPRSGFESVHQSERSLDSGSDQLSELESGLLWDQPSGWSSEP